MDSLRESAKREERAGSQGNEKRIEEGSGGGMRGARTEWDPESGGVRNLKMEPVTQVVNTVSRTTCHRDYDAYAITSSSFSGVEGNSMPLWRE